jgi:transposase
MIRSSKTTLRFANTTKRDYLNIFLEEYRRIVQRYIDIIWGREKIPSLLPKEITESVATWLSARMRQAAAKQASGIVRGTRQKQKQREWRYNDFVKKGFYKKARQLKSVIDKKKVSKPSVKNVCPELDSRFVKVDWDNKTSFDGWLTLSSIGGKMKMVFPLKKHEHFNSMLSTGKPRAGVRLSPKAATFMFELPDVPKRTEGRTIGIDIGVSDLFYTNEGVHSVADNHGHTLQTIIQKMCRRVRSSRGFDKSMEHRKNYINWSLNRLNLNGVKTLRREKLKDVRKGRQTSKFLNRFVYAYIDGKLDDITTRSGVQTELINPAFTSQRCSRCGWIQKSNRNGKSFECKSCGFECDSDLNGSRNIGLDLVPLGPSWRKLDNRKGFYWTEIGRESIVPDIPKLIRVG